METKTSEQDMIYELLKKSKLKQQMLPALRPVPTITSTSIIFSSIGVFCIALGTILLVYSKSVVEFILRYDEDCGTSNPCYLNIKLNHTMKSPIMVNYQLNNFYQNHRLLVKSLSPEQLKGKNLTYEELNKSRECDQGISNEEIDKLWAYNGQDLDLEAVAIPCGLMARSFFTDGYVLMFPNDTKIEIDEKNISWPADKAKFKNIESEEDPSYWEYVQWLDMTDEHFIVWMRPAAFPNFRKLWGRIREDLEPGDYIVKINNTYDVSTFNGEKFFILSTVNFFGSKNNFLGYAYIAVGCFCLCLAIAFFVWHLLHKNKRIKI